MVKDYVIAFTPGQFIATILAICAFITALSGAMGAIGKWIDKAKKPEKDQNTKIAELSERVKKLEESLNGDKSRLDQLEDGNRITQKALLALLSHGIDGNDIDSMREAKAELQAYLVNK